jgi:hypothetical protein
VAAFIAASKRKVGGRQAPGRLDPRALAEIGAGGADMGAVVEAVAERDRLAVARDILLDHDAVGAARHRRAGEDAHRLARPDLTAQARPAAASADDRQRAPGRVLGAHRVAIHRRGAKGGWARAGDDRLGEDAARGLGQRQSLRRA